MPPTPDDQAIGAAGSGDADLGSVWVANAAELPGFDVTRRTTGHRKPIVHGLSRIRRHQPDGHGTIPKPCVAGSIPARGAEPICVNMRRVNRVPRSNTSPAMQLDSSCFRQRLPGALARPRDACRLPAAGVIGSSLLRVVSPDNVG